MTCDSFLVRRRPDRRTLARPRAVWLPRHSCNPHKHHPKPSTVLRCTHRAQLNAAARSDYLAPSLEGLGQTAAAGVAQVRRLLEGPPPGFPPGPAGDSVLALLQDPLGFLQRVQQDHGDVVGLQLAGERAVLVADPVTARQVLVENPAVYVKAGTAFFPGSSLAGNGLLVSDGEVWRRQRQLAAPAFRQAAVERYAASMLRCTQEALLCGRRWREGAVRDVYADFNELTLRIALTTLFGADLDAAAAQEVVAAIQVAFEFFARRAATAFVIPEAVPTPDNVAFAAAVSRLDAAVYALIRQRRGAATSAAASRDLLDSLLASADADGAGMSDVAVRDELMTLLVAGQETSGILLAWACALLAHAPRAQAAAAAEVDGVLGGRPPGPRNARGSLPYLEAVILEALRVMPPAYLVGRCASQATTLGTHAISAGTTVLVSPYLLQRDVRRWGQDAAAFRPERWLEQQPEGGALAAAALAGMGPHSAYIPFGAGQRNCIGAGFAMMEAVLVLSSVLQAYRLDALPGAAFPAAEPRITLRPRTVRLMLRRRRR